MPHFKTPDGKLHFLSDADITNGGLRLLPSDAVEITDEEAAALAPAPSMADLARVQIADLEATVTPRRIREAVLGIDGGWLADLNEQIAALRAQLTV